MKKIKRIMLILNIIFIIALGSMIANLSNLSYRHSRLGAYSDTSKMIHDFYTEFNEKIIITWICWGLVFVFLLIQTYLEFRKDSISEEPND